MDAFNSWSNKTIITSVSYHRIGYENPFVRQSTNEAFSVFLMIFQFPKDDDVYKLFSCSKCTEKLPNRDERMDTEVMDGSAAGILEKLLNFYSRPWSTSCF